MADVAGEYQPSTSPDRISELARHKLHGNRYNRLSWSGMQVMWGTQDVLSPVSPAAARGRASERVTELARPKRNHGIPQTRGSPERVLSCGQSTPIYRPTRQAMSAQASDRVVFLANPKQPLPEFEEKAARRHHVFSCGRDSPIWSVSSLAKDPDSKVNEKYLGSLAVHKSVHADYAPLRSPHTVVTEPAKQAVATPVVESLALPKNRQDRNYRHPQWLVSEAARSATPTHRVGELAKYKPVSEHHLLDRSPITAVPAEALQAKCTPRLEELSQPVPRPGMDHLQFDPQAFTVKETALKAHCSARVRELAEPINR